MGLGKTTGGLAGARQRNVEQDIKEKRNSENDNEE